MGIIEEAEAEREERNLGEQRQDMEEDIMGSQAREVVKLGKRQQSARRVRTVGKEEDGGATEVSV